MIICWMRWVFSFAAPIVDSITTDVDLLVGGLATSGLPSGDVPRLKKNAISQKKKIKGW